MKKKVLVLLLLILLILYTPLLVTASETGIEDATNLSNNASDVLKDEHLNDTSVKDTVGEKDFNLIQNETIVSKKEPLEDTETADVIKEDQIKTGIEKLEPTKTVEPKIIEIKKRIDEISIITAKKRIFIDSETTDVKHIVLEIKARKASDLSAKEITIREFILEKNAVPEGRKELKLLRNEMTLGKFVELDLPTEDIDWTIIKIRYNNSEISDNNLNEDSLRVIWYDDDPASKTFEEWVKLRKGDPEWVNGVGVDQVENFVWANVSHISVYGMVGTIIGPLPTTEPPTPTPKPTTTPAPAAAAPTTTPPPTTVAPATERPRFIETEGPDVITQSTDAPKDMDEAIEEMAEPTQERKGVCGPTSILLFSLAPLFMLNGKIDRR